MIMQSQFLVSFKEYESSQIKNSEFIIVNAISVKDTLTKINSYLKKEFEGIDYKIEEESTEKAFTLKVIFNPQYMYVFTFTGKISNFLTI